MENNGTNHANDMSSSGAENAPGAWYRIMARNPQTSESRHAANAAILNLSNFISTLWHVLYQIPDLSVKRAAQFLEGEWLCKEPVILEVREDVPDIWAQHTH